MDGIKKIWGMFRQYLNGYPILFRLPGSISLFDEHPEYNKVIFLPAAIETHINFAADSYFLINLCGFL